MAKACQIFYQPIAVPPQIYIQNNLHCPWSCQVQKEKHIIRFKEMKMSDHKGLYWLNQFEFVEIHLHVSKN